MKQRQKGFGVLEVIIAIFILVVGLLALFGLSSRYLQAATNLKMKLTASFLAQEGIEIVRYVREARSEWSEWEWYKDPSEGGRSIGSSDTFIVEYSTADLLDYVDTPLLLDNGYYQYTSGQPSPFSRKLTLTRLSDDELKVEVEVKWEDRLGWHYIRAEDRLWNWK